LSSIFLVLISIPAFVTCRVLAREEVMGFVGATEASLWSGFGAPKGTPMEIVEKLNKEINVGLTDSNLRSRLADLGGTMLAGSPVDFGKLIADETEKWGKVVRAAASSLNDLCPAFHKSRYVNQRRQLHARGRHAGSFATPNWGWSSSPRASNADWCQFVLKCTFRSSFW
jgi:hypothetical protein